MGNEKAIFNLGSNAELRKEYNRQTRKATITIIGNVTMGSLSLTITFKNILEKKAFTVSVATEKYVKECDYLGLVSANDNPDKFAKTGFTVTHSARVNAPIINELPFALECELIDYDAQTGTMRGRIVNASCDESALTDGKIDVQKLAPITFDSANNAYVVLGQTVGKAFKDGLQLK